jgi:hypothetical protein
MRRSTVAVARSHAIHIMPSSPTAGGTSFSTSPSPFLTLFVCGLMVFPWIVWANTNRERHVTLHVDRYGNIVRTPHQR